MTTQFPGGLRRIISSPIQIANAGRNIKRMKELHKFRGVPQVKLKPRVSKLYSASYKQRMKRLHGYYIVFLPDGNGFSVPKNYAPDDIVQSLLDLALDPESPGSGRNFIEDIMWNMPDEVKVYRYESRVAESLDIRPYRRAILEAFREASAKMLYR